MSSNWKKLYKHCSRKNTAVLSESPLHESTLLLGPWEGATKVESLGLKILGKSNIVEERLSLEEIKKDLSLLKTKFKVTDRKEISNIVSSNKTTEFDTNKRHGFIVEDKLRIKIDEKCWDMMQCWMNMTNKEISGLGCVRQEKGGIFHIYEVFLLEQENTTSFTDINDMAVQKAMIELDELDSKDKGTRFTDMKFWWHSHVDYGTSWSSQDDHNIQEKLFGENKKEKPICPWWLSIVMNKKGEVNTRLDIAQPWITLEKVSYQIIHQVDSTIKEFCKKEYEEKVTENTTIIAKNTTNNAYDYGYHNYDNHNKRTNLTSNTIIREDTKTAYIPTTSPKEAYKKCTVQEAYELWESEIIDGLGWIYNLALNEKITQLETIGLAFKPLLIKREKFSYISNKMEPSDEKRWTISGSVNKKDYFLSIWPETSRMHLSIIDDINHLHGGMRRYLKEYKIGEDQFSDIYLSCKPEWKWENQESSICIGIVIKLPKNAKIPERLLGDITPIENLEEEITKNIKSNDDIDFASDNDYNDDFNDIAEEETIYDTVLKYAKTQTNSELLRRIGNWIPECCSGDLDNKNKEFIEDIIETLEENEFPKLIVNSETATKEEVKEAILISCKDNLYIAFTEMFILCASRSFCFNCFEPVTNDELQCPECRSIFEVV